ncbi:MAG: cytochrome C, partial [Deltaproteobacteria bacterium]|nr:cytochrome C [Deltaproteobacteria bacterium]
MILGLVLVLGPGSSLQGEDKAVLTLTENDCVKCHKGPPADVMAAGKAHKTEVTCLDCHDDHRPASKHNIPECSQCHEGEAHYELKSCAGCHKNPHAPLKIVLGKKVTGPCLSCHTDQIKHLKEFKTKHTSLFCSACHDVHRKVPDCVQCHKPHSGTMTQADCKKCHDAHRPMLLTYSPTIPNQDCGACHKTAFTKLTASLAKHKAVACVKCHEAKHRTVPDCQKCHPKPHPAGIMAKFPKCGTCHYTAHDLNNWPLPAKKKKKKA